MWPAHVSFPIDCNLDDTQGDGSSSHTAAFPAESDGKQSSGATLQFSLLQQQQWMRLEMYYFKKV